MRELQAAEQSAISKWRALAEKREKEIESLQQKLALRELERDVFRAMLADMDKVLDEWRAANKKLEEDYAYLQRDYEALQAGAVAPWAKEG